jgi:hypothetical protein
METHDGTGTIIIVDFLINNGIFVGHRAPPSPAAGSIPLRSTVNRHQEQQMQQLDGTSWPRQLCY